MDPTNNLNAEAADAVDAIEAIEAADEVADEAEEEETILKNNDDSDDEKEQVDVVSEYRSETQEECPDAETSWQRSLAKRPSCTQSETGLLALYSYFSFQLDDFQQFGVGIYLYFRFLRQMTKLFLFMFILSLPLILSSLSAAKIEQTQYAFEQTTIGNLGSAEAHPVIEYPDYIDMASVPIVGADYVNPADNSIDKRDAGCVFAWSDLFSTLVFLLFLTRVKMTQAKVAQAADDSMTTVADFSVRVTGLPLHYYNREELQVFFESHWGKVVDVALCYNDTGIVNKYIDKSNTVGHKESALKRNNHSDLKSLDKKLIKINRKLHETKTKFSKKTVCAYVTFNDATHAAECLMSYPNTFLSKLCMPSKLKLRKKYKLRVEKAPEPSEIIYENMRFSTFNVRIRRFITFVLAFVVILVSCGMTLAAAIYRKQNLESKAEEDASSAEEYADCANLTAADLSANADTLTDDEIECLCSQLSLTDLSSSDYSAVCASYISNLLISNLLTALSSVMIVIINIALKFVSRMLVKFEKHVSVTKMERELTWKMFAGMFFNTALVLLVVNANTTHKLGFSVIAGDYQDFVPEWYSIVGASLLLTMILNMINPHALPVLLYPFTKCCRHRKSMQAMTVREMDAVFEGESFILAERYAVILNTTWVAFFYSSGMPLLLLVACLTFFLTYCCDKFTLLKRCKLPPKYNIEVAQFTITLLKPVIYIHLAISIWVFGSQTVLLNHDLRVNEIPENSSDFRQTVESTVMNYSVFPTFLALVILLTYDITLNILTTLRLKQLFFAIVTKLLRCLCFCCCKKTNEIHVQEDIGLFLDEIENGNVFESYLLSHQEIYSVAYIKGSGLFHQQPLYKKQEMVQRQSL